VLSEQQIEFFNEQGYVVFDPGLKPAFLDRIVERVYPLYDESFRQNPVSATRLQDVWRQVNEVRQLATHKAVMTALGQLYDRRPKPFQTLNFPIGTSQLPHSDTIHFNCVPKNYMAGVWVALEDIHANNGPLIYYPGSHKLPEYSMQDLGLEPGYEQYPAYEQAIQEVIRREQLEPAYGTIRKGEALIWHANLLHGGARQEDTSYSRHSQVTHYYFEGCRYYTPMLSSAEQPAFRDPEWIPETRAAAVLRTITRLAKRRSL